MSPRSKKQYEEIREQSRSKILIAALEVFAKNGYPGSSIDQIAKEAGVAKGSVYHYFKSKEAVLEAVIVNGLAEFENIMKAVKKQTSAAAQLRTLITVSFEAIEQEKDFWQLYFSLITQLNLPKSLERIMVSVIAEMLDFTRGLLEALEVAEPLIESKILGATMDGAFLHYLMIGDDYPLEEVKNRIINKYIQQ